jgi:hypothetical protein
VGARAIANETCTQRDLGPLRANAHEAETRRD